MSKELTPLEAFNNIKCNCNQGYPDYERNKKLVETALKDYQELLKIDCKQNTINDFYPNTKVMIDDLLELVATKMCDFLKEGIRYTRTGVLETLGCAIRYVKTFAYGGEFNETKKIGVREKKLKALEIVKEMLDSDIAYKFNANSRKTLKEIFESLPKEKQDLLKEVLL